MSRYNKGLVFAMEQEGLEVPQEGEGATEVSGEVESAVADLNTDAGEVSDLTTAIEDAVAGAEDLEDLHSVMADSAESGEGLNETGAKVAEIAIESLYNRLGIKARPMPGLESFGSTQSRATATRVGMEGVMDGIKKVWESIKAAFIAMWNKIKGWYKNLFDANIKLGKEAKEIGATCVSKTTGKKKSAEVLDNGSLFEALNISGKVDASTVSTLLSNHSETITIGGAVIDDGVKLVETISPVIESISVAGKAEGADKADHSAIATKVKAAIAATGAAMKSTLKDFNAMSNGTHEGMVSLESPQLVGNKKMIISAAVASGDAHIDSSVFKFEVTEFKPAGSGKGVCHVLTGEEMAKLCKEVEILSGNVDKMKIAQGKLGNFEKAINSLIDKVVKKVSSLNGQEKFGDEQKSALTIVKRSVTDINSMISGYATQTPKLATTAEKTALNYVSACLKMYVEGKPV
jgi:hypothetical protein